MVLTGVDVRKVEPAGPACPAKSVSSPFAACVSALPLRYKSLLQNRKKKRARPTVLGARGRPGAVSAGRLGGTHALALLVVCEEDLGYDPAPPRPPLAPV